MKILPMELFHLKVSSKKNELPFFAPMQIFTLFVIYFSERMKEVKLPRLGPVSTPLATQ